jgi:hypothetical protein
LRPRPLGLELLEDRLAPSDVPVFPTSAPTESLLTAGAIIQTGSLDAGIAFAQTEAFYAAGVVALAAFKGSSGPQFLGPALPPPQGQGPPTANYPGNFADPTPSSPNFALPAPSGAAATSVTYFPGVGGGAGSAPDDHGGVFDHGAPGTVTVAVRGIPVCMPTGPSPSAPPPERPTAPSLTAPVAAPFVLIVTLEATGLPAAQGGGGEAAAWGTPAAVPQATPGAAPDAEVEPCLRAVPGVVGTLRDLDLYQSTPEPPVRPPLSRRPGGAPPPATDLALAELSEAWSADGPAAVVAGQAGAAAGWRLWAAALAAALAAPAHRPAEGREKSRRIRQERHP